ncbi:VOC family protein [Neobacillus mesonae]|uniref:VOC family protein n=1 Tax=Neobacillus mesonae TaxID=1193713 RepID=UPI00203D04F6|nr:VOC family protein [Neobacillus mesonae]MCM3571026.1 VOC family protein [Neobacillus mesonae]
MDFEFDHLVFFSNKPEDTIGPLKQKGIHAVNGGRHENWGTYNSLTYFGLSYIEFLGVEHLSISEQQEENRLVTEIVEKLIHQHREGPAKLAIRTNQLDELAERFKAEGFMVYGPLPGERVRGDGKIIKWSLLFPESKTSELSLPFFIQWEKTDEERLAEFQEQGLTGSHTTGNPTFFHVGIVVRDLEKTLQEWRKLVDLPVTEAFLDTDLNARCQILKLAGTELLFCTPLGEGIAQKVLHEKGETPFLVNLNGTEQEQLYELMGGFWRFNK